MCLGDEIKPLPLSTRLLPQPRNTIVPGRKTLCVCVYIRTHVRVNWYRDNTKRAPIQRKGLRYIHLEPKIKEIEGEQVCAEDWGRRGRIDCPFAKGIAQVILQFPLALAPRAAHTLKHNVWHLCKQISFHRACLPNQIQLRGPCLDSLCEYRQIYSVLVPYIYLRLWTTRRA